MSGRFSTYEHPSSQRYSTILNLNGAASKEDDLFVTKLLSTFVNKQSALFQRWVKVRITENNNGYNEFTKYTSNNQQSYGSKHPKPQLLVLTPLKIISLPTIQSPKRMKQFRIIDIISLFIEENTNCYLKVKKTKKSSKKLTKPKKRTMIQVVHGHPDKLYPVTTSKKRHKKRNKDKVLTSYPIVQYKPNYVNTAAEHSLSPPPSTSFEQPNFNDFAATDEEEQELSNTGTSLGGYNAWIYHCSIKFHKLDVLNMSYDKLLLHNSDRNPSDNLEHDILDIYFESKDVAKEFLDILQFYLFTLYRGVPMEYKPKVEIIPSALNEEGLQLSDEEMKGHSPFVPSQVFIDRYVAYCDAQKIQALDSVIDYVIHTNNDDIFDVAASFSHHTLLYRNGHPIACSEDIQMGMGMGIGYTTLSVDLGHSNYNQKQTKNIQQQQYVALSHALAFLKMYKKLCVDRLNTDDSNIATLMKIFETNPYIQACEFRKCAIKKITMQALSWSLRSGVSSLRELSIADINMSRSVLKDLDLENCNLTKLVLSKCSMSEKTCVYLFNELVRTQQYESIVYLDISHNHCDKEGTKVLSSFIFKTLTIQSIIVNDSRIDGNIFFNGLHLNNYNNVGIKHHLQCLLYLDFSGNNIGDHGARKLSNFVQSAQSLQCLKLSRCNMSTEQLHKIFEGALANNSGLDSEDLVLEESKSAITMHQSQNNNVLLSYRPTRCDLIQCQDLMRLTLDLSYNSFGAKGSRSICRLLQNRLLGGNIGNYSIVSLSLAGNNFDIGSLSQIIGNLHCCICLESLNISDNITKQNIISFKHKKKSGPTLLGHSLVNLCREATKLERLIMNTNDLSVGLEPFLSGLAYLSNLKFIDLSNTKLNDKHVGLLITALSYNRTFIRALKISQNKISSQCLIEYLQLLSNHTSLIDVNTCLPMQHIIKYKKIKKYSATFTRLQNEASLNLRGNKFQYDIDKKMVSSLPIRERLEKVLRLQCGEQFGIPLECVRGTIKFCDYTSRIPKILINLRNYLKSKGGFKTREIFRFHADATQFSKFKQDLNANNKNAKTDDTHSIANAIKAFYHDLPVKVLNNVNIAILASCKNIAATANVMKLIKEPYRSLFEWLLDLCVEIVTCEKVNKMSHRSMAVVLCPSLYNAFSAVPTSKILRSVMEFTDLAIQHRIAYRRESENLSKYEEEIIADPTLRILIAPNININIEQINRWNNVMKDLTESEIELQSWNNCTNIKEKDQNTFCYSIDRLTFVLQYYRKWLMKRNLNPHRQSITKEMNKYNHRMIDFLESLSNYNNVQLQNDFNHILRYHSSDEELENIANNLCEAMAVKGCTNITQCTPMKRNNRNRDQDEKRPWKMKIYFGYEQSEEICTQQILDKLHCYFFHTFDTLRLTKTEKRLTEEENEGLKLLKQILTGKQERLVQIRGQHRVKGTKFSSNIALLIQRINNNNHIYCEDDEDIYTLGQNFDTHKKYNNFKEELLHNNLHWIACDSWNDTYCKAEILHKTGMAKQMKSIQEPCPFNIQHLMAVLLYCDFDNLRFSLNATFYPQSMDETVTNWKLRNAEYCHWTQCLRAAAAAAAAVMGEKHPSNIFYHSSTNQTFVSPKPLQFCYPMSCNQHLSLVHTFAPKDGVILALKHKHSHNHNHIYCNWISDYANYDEHIVFGDNVRFAIQNIVSIELCQDYQSFWNAINVLYHIINGIEYDHIIEEDMHSLSLLLQSHLKLHLIPAYIQSLFESFCRDYILGQITLNPSHFVSLPTIYKYLFDETGFIRIGLFCNLFINISSIKIMNVILNENIFDCIFTFLQTHTHTHHTKRRGAIQKRKSSVLDLISHSSSDSPHSAHMLSLTDIHFVNVNEKYISCTQSVNKYKQCLNDIGWNIQHTESVLYIQKKQ